MMGDRRNFLAESIDYYLLSNQAERWSAHLSLVSELGSAAVTAVGLAAAINGNYIGVPVAVAGATGIVGFHSVYKSELTDALKDIETAEDYLRELESESGEDA